MKYYLIPITGLRYEDQDKVMQIFLKNIHPFIYQKYQKNYQINELILKELDKNNLPTHFLFQGKKLKKKNKVKEIITDFEFTFPYFYLLNKQVSKLEALHYLTNLKPKQILSIINSLYQYVYNDETKVKKIIPFPKQNNFRNS